MIHITIDDRSVDVEREDLEVEESPAQFLAWLPVEMFTDLVSQLEGKA